MKILIAIFVLLITAAYSLPLKDLFNGYSVSYVIDSDEFKLDEKKEEKTNKLINCLTSKAILNPELVNPFSHFLFIKSQFLHQVETPPPDFI